MGGYGVYVYGAWLIAYLAMGIVVYRDHVTLRALIKGATHDQ